MYSWSKLLDAVARTKRWDAIRATLEKRIRLHEHCESTAPSDRPLDAVVLESRVLYSASPLVEMMAAVSDADDSPSAISDDGFVDDHVFDHEAFFWAPLAGGTGAAPTLELPDSVTMDEDTPSVAIVFNVFDADTPRENLQITATSSDHRYIRDENLFVRTDGGQFSLVIKSERDMHSGPVSVSIHVSDGVHSVSDSMQVTINPVNDRPEAVALNDLTVNEGERSSTIDLRAAFHDVDNLDSELTFSVTDVSNHHLFSAITIDQARGTLTLAYAPGASGNANLTIRATDPDGEYVEIGPEFRPLKIYEALSQDDYDDKLDMAALGIDKITLFTQWALFDFVDGAYEYDSINYSLLRRALENFSPAGIPVSIDIENETYFGNDIEGRDHLAEVIRFAHEVRPDLEIGFYKIMPEGNWWTTMYQERLHADLEAGLNTWYTQNQARFDADYLGWQIRNSWYREVPLTNDGGKTLSDYAENIQVSLYTPYRHFWTRTYEARNVTIDSTTDRLTSTYDYQDGMAVVFTTVGAGTLPSHINGSTKLYVVNATDDSFQLSTTPNGVAIDFNYATNIVNSKLSRWLSLESDIDVRDWHAYGEYNALEAHKYGNLPAYAWISPSIRGIGRDFLEGEFFEQQLEILADLYEAVVIYEPSTHDRDFHELQGWWDGLNDFVEKQNAAPTWFSVTVNDVNQRPTAADDVYVINGRTPLHVSSSGLLANDHDIDSASIRVLSATQTKYGQLTWRSDGSFDYTRTDYTSASDSFRYTVVDSEGLTSQANVRLTFINSFFAPSPTLAMSNIRAPEAEPTVVSSFVSPLAAELAVGPFYAPLNEAVSSESLVADFSEPAEHGAWFHLPASESSVRSSLASEPEIDLRHSENPPSYWYGFTSHQMWAALARSPMFPRTADEEQEEGEGPTDKATEETAKLAGDGASELDGVLWLRR
jgi:hypothetical protein